MKILLVNKFLYPKGGSETYMFNLGNILSSKGHSVEYFGLQNEKNTVGNSIGSYVSDIDFSKGAKKNIKAPLRIIYSSEARKKIRAVLDRFQPDIIHFNNIQFHLTPSVILEAEKYRRKSARKVKIIYTAHDFQLVCPSHGMFDSEMNICEKCLDGNYFHCIKGRCMKRSRAKSFLAAADACFWKTVRAYEFIDKIICPSYFLKSKLDTQERFKEKTTVIHNFVGPDSTVYDKEDYILQFGHLSKDKGTLTLLEAAKRMPEKRFVFAGYGEAEDAIAQVPNAEFAGFKTGDELKSLIGKAACSVCSSEIYENCPFSVIESQMYGTPVIGSGLGGIPELIRENETGLIFEAGNPDELVKKLRFLLESEGRLKEFAENCKNMRFETSETYYEKIMQIYGE